MIPTTIPLALDALMRVDSARPLVTYVGPAGERTELSVRTFENNVAKAANLLRDDAGATVGTRVALHLPAHWQTSVWIGACALVGAVAWIAGEPSDPLVELSVVGPRTLDVPRAPLTLATALHPFGMPFTTPLPQGILDVALEVRAHGDRFTPYDAIHGDESWLLTSSGAWTQSEALQQARDFAGSVGLPDGGRLLCTRGLDDTSLLALLAVPLVVGGSVVILADESADPDEVAARERCEVILRPDARP